jgi:broad specificity phosphatase PhoE
VKQLGKFWQDAVRNDGVPLPQTLYTSPLARCLETTEYVFAPVMRVHGRPFAPIVKEQIRERFTVHTCDLRRPRSWIEQNYTGYTIENDVTQEDQFAGQKRWETDDEHYARKQEALEQIFSSDKNDFVSLTVHSYAVAAILAVCKGEVFRIREGTSMALLVRGEEHSEHSKPDAGVNKITVTAPVLPN